ncbi:interferon alpha-inducible protein 27-like protein 2A isoform X2 [Gambusia affinis]|uniref:interferon alpha-inducible protein 27-like protein 2A isoform X2 n=1 Tax=Gambusia affinis TaxID=33528 RepID=UPI001CDBD2DF|nr:interferon alpha-inducible protein 27-like protein 2A isoform X2 [Gambusia affinis]
MEEEICKYIVTGAGGVATVVLTPVLLASLGFTATGIASGSIAAKMMSLFAIFYGGGILPGSLVATLQSIESGGLERTFRPEGKLLLKTVFGEMQNNNNKNHLNVWED